MIPTSSTVTPDPDTATVSGLENLEPSTRIASTSASSKISSMVLTPLFCEEFGTLEADDESEKDVETGEETGEQVEDSVGASTSVSTTIGCSSLLWWPW